MPNYMKLIVMGHLTNDPETRETGAGIKVGNCGIAYNEKDRDPVFIDCVLFGQTAEFLAKHFKKGDAILMEGRLQTNRWTGSDNVERVKLQLKVEKVSFTGKSGERGGFSGGQTETHQEQYGSKRGPVGADKNDDLAF